MPKAPTTCECGKPWRYATPPLSAQPSTAPRAPKILPGCDHDDTCMSRIFTCSSGHTRRITLRRSCPVCSWQGSETCTYPPHNPKFDGWPETQPPEEKTW